MLLQPTDNVAHTHMCAMCGHNKHMHTTRTHAQHMSAHTYVCTACTCSTHTHTHICTTHPLDCHSNICLFSRHPQNQQQQQKNVQIFAAEYIDANNLKVRGEDHTHVLSVLEYLAANQWEFETEDSVYVLSFSIMMLHTSLHNPSVKYRDSKEQWLKMNRGTYF